MEALQEQIEKIKFNKELTITGDLNRRMEQKGGNQQQEDSENKQSME